MNTSTNNFDSIEKLIYEENLHIEAIDIHTELGVMLVILNTKALLHQKLLSYTRLKTQINQHYYNINLLVMN